MTENRNQRVFSRSLKIKPNEFNISFLLFFYLFLVTSIVSMAEPVKISLDLDKRSFENLPWANPVQLS